MFESASCTWCQRWHDEIGEIYPKTSDARCAPLRRVDLGDPRPIDLAEIKGVIYTPTFVLIDDGREIARWLAIPAKIFSGQFLPITLQNSQTAVQNSVGRASLSYSILIYRLF